MNKRSCILIGMAGVGKSTVGPFLAEKLGFGFVDVDEAIFEKYGKTVAEILAAEGDEGFSQKEEQTIREINLQEIVMAPGGSIVYHEDLMNDMRKQTMMIYLRDEFENIKERLEKKQGIQNIVGIRTKSLEQVFKERLPLYEKYAEVTIDVQGKSPEVVAEEIMEKLEV
ncbi:MAG: shikimate kinase [Candidatus Wildermuthbacteria bacterium]|nr:shikimate kinase [Candidatus Wildermuthbacteria bacterium]